MLAAMPGIGTRAGVGRLWGPWGRAAGKQSAGGADVAGKGMGLSQLAPAGGSWGRTASTSPHCPGRSRLLCLIMDLSVQSPALRASVSLAGRALPASAASHIISRGVPPSSPTHAWGPIPGGEGGSWQPCCSQPGSVGLPTACCGWPCLRCHLGGGIRVHVCVGTCAWLRAWVCAHMRCCRCACTCGRARACLCVLGLHAHTGVGVRVCALAHMDVHPSRLLLLPPVTPVLRWQRADLLQAHDYFLGGEALLPC